MSKRKKFKMPKTVRIDGQDFILTDHKKGKFWGRVSTARNLIEIAFRRRGAPVTLLHEIIHVIAYYRGLKISEKDIIRLSAGIYAAIRDNDLDFRKDY